MWGGRWPPRNSSNSPRMPLCIITTHESAVPTTVWASWDKGLLSKIYLCNSNGQCSAWHMVGAQTICWLVQSKVPFLDRFAVQMKAPLVFPLLKDRFWNQPTFCKEGFLDSCWPEYTGLKIMWDQEKISHPHARSKVILSPWTLWSLTIQRILVKDLCRHGQVV